MNEASAPVRCSWCGTDPLYVAYHDDEWGVPERDEARLFEMLCLEGQQAGLSWITVLRKRERYREVFAGFEIERVASMTGRDVDRIVTDAGVIRHRGKLEAILDNAKAARELQETEGVGLGAYLWSLVGDAPIVNRFRDLASIPAQTELSKAMSKGLKKRGFRFVGPTTCYAFMQATGMVNDHFQSCFRHAELGG